MTTPKKTLEFHESFRPCRDFIIVMIPLMIMAGYLYGARPLLIFLIAIVEAFVCDLLSCLLQGKRYDVTDISSYMFALILVLMLPASVNYGIVLIGVAFTVLIGKHAFGGYGRYPFHPAAFGFAFINVCFADAIYLYPRSFSAIGTSWNSGATLYAGITNSLKFGGVPSIDFVDLFLGNYPGPMGTTFCLIILACMVLFIVHKTISWQITLTFLATCAAFSAVFPRVQTGRLDSLVYEMLSGSLIFAAVFIIPEPSSTPSKPAAKLLYGFLLGIVTVLYRNFGAYEMDVCFAVLLMSPVGSWLERLANREKKPKKTARRAGELKR